MKKTQGRGYKLYQERVHLDITNNFLTLIIISHWKKIPRDVVESPSLEVFKI